MAKGPEITYIRFYTDGSAARQVAPKKPLPDTLKLPRIQRRKSTVVHLDPVAVLGIAVACCLLIMMIVGFVQLNQANARLVQSQEQIQVLEQRQQTLREEYEQGYDLETVRRTALAMGMVPAEEVPHILLHMQLQEPQKIPEHVSLWAQIGNFLTGLFA